MKNWESKACYCISSPISDEPLHGVGLEQLRRIEGTVLLHMSFAIKQDQVCSAQRL
jgi:hypothetical protein